MDTLSFILHVYSIAMTHHADVVYWIRRRDHDWRRQCPSNDLHVYGLAADLTFDEHADKLGALVAAKQLGLSAVDAGDYVHLQARPLRPEEIP